MYAQAGAQWGYSVAWTMLFTYPLLAAIQEISARIGCATGSGLVCNARRYFSGPRLRVLVALVFLSNTITIAADLGVMGETVAKVVPGWPALHAVGFGIVSLALQQRLQYTRYVSFLKWLTLSLLSYGVVFLVIHPPWRQVARGLIVPDLRWDFAFWSSLVTVLGSTISPAMLLWQASQEAEDSHPLPGAIAVRSDPPQAMERIRLDTVLGMGFSNLVGLAIMLSTATTLHAGGATQLKTALDVAQALRPLAGRFAAALFAIGIAGSGLLAVPVLAGSAAYALGESLAWPTGLKCRPGEAKGFYGAVIIATVLGALLNLSPIDPMAALNISAIASNLASVPFMIVLMLVSTDRTVMGAMIVSGPLKFLGWLATGVMGIAPVAMGLSRIA